MVLVDMSAGSATPFPTSFGKNQFRSIHQEYQEAAQNSASQESALDRLLSRYATLFGPLLEPILPFLTAKHLKIFPRLQMNAVPFHALRLHGKYLLEHCAHQLVLHEPGDRVEVNLVR
jgi:hypothetical protein